MADDQDRSDEALPWEVPKWLAARSPALASALPTLTLPPGTVTILRRILADAKVKRAWGEITRTTGAMRKAGSRHHPLTVLNATLLRRHHNIIRADAMAAIERLAAMPETETRATIFLTLVLLSAIIAAIPTLEDAAPELRQMLVIMDSAVSAMESLSTLGRYDASHRIADEVHQAYAELRNRRGLDGPIFPNRKYREQALLLSLGLITRGQFHGRTLRQTIANIASAALGRTISPGKVDGILKRHLKAWATAWGKHA